MAGTEETVVFKTGLIWDVDLAIEQLQAAGIGCYRRAVNEREIVREFDSYLFQQNFGEGIHFEIIVSTDSAADALRVIKGLGLIPEEQKDPDEREENEVREEQGYQAYQTRATYVEQGRSMAYFYVIACAVLTVIIAVIGLYEWLRQR